MAKPRAYIKVSKQGSEIKIVGDLTDKQYVKARNRMVRVCTYVESLCYPYTVRGNVQLLKSKRGMMLTSRKGCDKVYVRFNEIKEEV